MSGTDAIRATPVSATTNENQNIVHPKIFVNDYSYWITRAYLLAILEQIDEHN